MVRIVGGDRGGTDYRNPTSRAQYQAFNRSIEYVRDENRHPCTLIVNREIPRAIDDRSIGQCPHDLTLRIDGEEGTGLNRRWGSIERWQVRHKHKAGLQHSKSSAQARSRGSLEE